MDPAPNQPDPARHRRMLARMGVLPAGKAATLVEYPPAYARKRSARREHYRVEAGGKSVCHLMVGRDLAPVHERVRAFAAACPELVCRPLAFSPGDEGLDYLCLEHFAGESLDRLVEQGKCPDEAWRAYVRQAHAALEATRAPSTPEALAAEVDELVAAVSESRWFTPLDRELLRGPIRDAVVSGAGRGAPTRQWTNGDFVGRNLLVNAAGEIRLVDYESAALTHFGAEDWLRLLEFSILPEGVRREGLPEAAAVRQPGHEIRFWLHHLIQLQGAQSTPARDRHRHECISRLLIAWQRSQPSGPAGAASFLLQTAVQGQATALELQAERTAWAKSLEQELETARRNFSNLATEHAKGTAWAKSVSEELARAQQDHAKLVAEFAERTQWAQSLEKECREAQAAGAEQGRLAAERLAWAQRLEEEKQQLQATFEAQAKEFAERTAWARSLETDLAAARANHQQVTAELEKRTAWARSLETDLAAAQARHQQLAAELAERTQWTQKLQADLAAAQTHHQEIAAELESRTAWTRSLEADLAKVRQEHARVAADFAERTAWAQSLEADLGAVRKEHARVTAEFAERTAWAKSLEADLEAVRKEHARVTAEFAERTAWAKSLETDLERVRAEHTRLIAEFAGRTAWAQSLEADLGQARAAYTRLAAEFAERTAWAQSLEHDLQQLEAAKQQLAQELEELHQAGAGFAVVLPGSETTPLAARIERSRVAIAGLNRELAAATAAARTAAAGRSEVQLQLDAARGEMVRLGAGLADAQLHLDSLLRTAADLQAALAAMTAARDETEARLQQRTDEGAALRAELEAIRLELARYESRWLCRVLAGAPRPAARRPNSPT